MSIKNDTIEWIKTHNGKGWGNLKAYLIAKPYMKKLGLPEEKQLYLDFAGVYWSAMHANGGATIERIYQHSSKPLSLLADKGIRPSMLEAALDEFEKITDRDLFSYMEQKFNIDDLGVGLEKIIGKEQ